MVRFFLMVFALWSTLLSSGCPGTVSTDTGGGGMDALGGVDTPSAIDTPSGIDTPGTDAPVATSDVPTTCSGLAAAACIGALCVPSFDDTCCRDCPPPGPCADCTNIDWIGCQPRETSPCTTGCGTAPDWVCNDSLPDCTGATVVDVDSCTRTGCVPAFPTGSGAPVLSTATCVPIVATSCTVACRIPAPECPTGTYAEGDGACYTDRCIPTFVCLMR